MHCFSSLKLLTWVHNKGKKKKKSQRGSTEGKINYMVGYLAYVAYNKGGLNHVHASSRETNPWKNISHERIMRLIWMCQSKGSKSH